MVNFMLHIFYPNKHQIVLNYNPRNKIGINDSIWTINKKQGNGGGGTALPYVIISVDKCGRRGGFGKRQFTAIIIKIDFANTIN